MTLKTLPSMAHFWRTCLALIAVLTIATAKPTDAHAQSMGADNHYSADEIVNAGHTFFGGVTGELASLVEKAFSRFGLPNGYILGEEGSGAVALGARYGEGQLHTKNMGVHKIFWQGPSLGFDLGADGNRTMMLVYNIPSVDYIYRRWGGVNGSAYLVGGLGFTVLATESRKYILPIRSGVGARLGVNVGYLKFTQKPTWNPF